MEAKAMSSTGRSPLILRTKGLILHIYLVAIPSGTFALATTFH